LGQKTDLAGRAGAQIRGLNTMLRVIMDLEHDGRDPSLGAAVARALGIAKSGRGRGTGG